MKLNMTIKNIKAIKNLTMQLPLEKGLYAITGENATGKSTITMCASSLFYHFDPQQYFGKVAQDSMISFELNGQTQTYTYDLHGKTNKNGRINIKGFFEGSLIFGNRFRNTSYHTVSKLNAILDEDLEPADNFIKENLGLILCNDKTYYKDLYRLKRGLHNKYHLGGTPFFYMRDGLRILQARIFCSASYILLRLELMIAVIQAFLVQYS